MAENGTLSEKQEKAITALLTAGTVRAAAKAYGIGERTLYRWMADPTFRERLRQAQAEALDATVRQLTDAASVAVVVLRTLMVDESISAGARVRAAGVIIGNIIAFKNALELEQRIEALEEKLGVKT